VVEILKEPEGIRCIVEVDEMARAVTGQTQITVDDESVIETV